MVIKQRSGWGYETLVREVSDSLHLRRFCLIAIDGRVPHESTIRKLTRRLGPEIVNELSRELLAKAVRERRFKPRAARIDSTVIEADVRYPSDAMLALQGARALARQGQRLSTRIGNAAGAVRDRSRAIGRRVRQISRTLGRRTGEAREQVIELNRQAGELLRRSARQARRLARPGALEGPRPRRAGKAAGRGADRRAGGALRARRRADLQASQGQQDQRPDRLARRSRRAPDPQGQGGQADRVRLRRPDLRADRFDQAGLARADPPRHRPPRATRARTRCCHRPSPSSTGPDPADRDRPRRWFRPDQVRRVLPDLSPSGSSSPGAESLAHAEPNGARATEPASRAT